MAIQDSIKVVNGNYSLVMQNNQAYSAKLNTLLKGLPKRVLGVYAATALHNAQQLSVTKHDSSRAAANWNLQVGNSPIPQHLDPGAYGTSPIGQRGDAGSHAKRVMDYKRQFWNYYKRHGAMIPKKGGVLWSAIGVGKAGTAPVVRLYNPVFSLKFDHYAKNAFVGAPGEVSEMIKRASGGGVPLSELSRTAIPNLVRELARELRWKYAEGSIK